MANPMMEVEAYSDDERDAVVAFLKQSAELLKIFLPNADITVSDGWGNTNDY